LNLKHISFNSINITLKQDTTLAIGKQNARGMIDAETIKTVQDNFCQTLTGTLENYRIAHEKREQLSADIDRMRIEFKQNLQSATSGNAITYQSK
jgi:uncharacterized protein YaaN involved in tellurite resistance